MKIYPVMPSHTGRSQPHSEAVRLEACLAGPPGGPYVDLRQSIDAPEYIPTGSVRALDFPGTATLKRLDVSTSAQYRCDES